MGAPSGQPGELQLLSNEMLFFWRALSDETLSSLRTIDCNLYLVNMCFTVQTMAVSLPQLIPYVNLIHWCLFLARLNYQPQQKTQPPKGPSQKNSSCYRFLPDCRPFVQPNILITSMSIWSPVKSSDCQGFQQYMLWTLASAPRYMFWVPTNQPWFISLIRLSYGGVDIFRMASLAFTAAGWQTEQQSERRRRSQRRRQRSKSVTGMRGMTVWHLGMQTAVHLLYFLDEKHYALNRVGEKSQE